MGYAALPLANTISTLFNFLMLYYFLRKVMGPLGGKSIFKTFCKILLASCIMALVVLGSAEGLALLIPKITLSQRILTVFVPIALALPVYLGLARLLKIEESKMFSETIFIRFKRLVNK